MNDNTCSHEYKFERFGCLGAVHYICIKCGDQYMEWTKKMLKAYIKDLINE